MNAKSSYLALAMPHFAMTESWSLYKCIFTACPFMFMFGLLIVGSSFFACFKMVPLIRPFLAILGFSVIGLSVVVAVLEMAILLWCCLGVSPA